MAKPAALKGIPDEPKRGRRGPAKPQTVGEIQAVVENVPAELTVQFMGETFRLDDTIGFAPLVRYALAADEDVATDDLEGIVALSTMLKDMIHPDEWRRFIKHGTINKAQAEDFVAVITRAIEVLAARPTQQPSDSSAGLPSTSPSSTGSSSSPATPTGQVTEQGVTFEDLDKQAG